jgi:hypothetical protein
MSQCFDFVIMFTVEFFFVTFVILKEFSTNNSHKLSSWESDWKHKVTPKTLCTLQKNGLHNEISELCGELDHLNDFNLLSSLVLFCCDQNWEDHFFSWGVFLELLFSSITNLKGQFLFAHGTSETIGVISLVIHFNGFAVNIFTANNTLSWRRFEKKTQI